MEQKKVQNEIDQIDSFVIRWNFKNPLDYWWRKKYSIPFGSKSHLAAKQFDIIIEFFEAKMMNLANVEGNTVDEDMALLEPYVPGSGSIFRTKPMTQEMSELDTKSLDKVSSLEDLGFTDNGKITMNG